jgi:hypothetical protein
MQHQPAPLKGWGQAHDKMVQVTASPQSLPWYVLAVLLAAGRRRGRPSGRRARPPGLLTASGAHRAGRATSPVVAVPVWAGAPVGPLWAAAPSSVVIPGWASTPTVPIPASARTAAAAAVARRASVRPTVVVTVTVAVATTVTVSRARRAGGAAWAPATLRAAACAPRRGRARWACLGRLLFALGL